MNIRPILVMAAMLAAMLGNTQQVLRGTILDSSRSYPLEAVTVMSTSGKGTRSDADGRYAIEVSDRDSVWFSYLGKPTIKFPVKNITDLTRFDLSLKVPVTVLSEVKIRPRNFRQDSIQNRRDYAKVFEWHRPNASSMTSIGPMGAGIDLDELIRVFQFRRNRSTAVFQQRLLQQERDKFIDHRFTKVLVRRLTGLNGEALEAFMRDYRPPYEAALYASDYDFQELIKISFELYKKEKGL